MSDRLRTLTATEDRLAATLRLVALQSIGVSRCRWLLAHADAEDVVRCLERGRLPEGLPDPPTTLGSGALPKWRNGLLDQDVSALLDRNLAESQLVIDAGHPSWPFAHDPDPPVLLFIAGNPELLAAERRVAVVGTRRCSAVGKNVAAEIGWTLAEHGIAVVSGLALGIDAAAHRGAGTSTMNPGRIAVVASGVDMVYPPRNEQLWREIEAAGVIVSETPMGELATRWRFPARNRLIAGLAEVVVVVESHERGGSLITADEAIRRNVEVVAVPGSVLASCCVGTNQLLMDGIPPIRCGRDVIEMLGVTHNPPRLPLPGEHPGPAGEEDTETESISREEGLVLDALKSGGIGIDGLAEATELPISELLVVIERLKSRNLAQSNGAEVTSTMREEQ